MRKSPTGPFRPGLIRTRGHPAWAGRVALGLLLGGSAALAGQEDVDRRVQVTFSGLTLNRATHTFDTLATLTNTSPAPLSVPLSLVVTSLTPSEVTVANASGTTATGQPFLDVPVPGGRLAPGARFPHLLVKFRNPNRVPFRFTTRVLAVLSATPEPDTIPPVLRITSPTAGREFPVGTTQSIVRGTINDPAATVRVNGLPATSSGGIFSAPVPLVPGPNTLTAVGTDPAGNAASAAIHVQVRADPTPPASRS